MLTYNYNKLLNLVLQMEQALNDIGINSYNTDVKTIAAVKIIDRNLQSVKKTIKRLSN